MTTVHLEPCADYRDVRRALGELWRRLGAADLVAGKNVLIKVNLTKGGPPDWAVATHPEFAAALVELVREAGGQPRVGDSCSIYGFTRETMDLAGYADMARRLDAPLTPLDSGRIREVAVDGVRVKRLYMSEHVLDADVVISAPKLKPHDFVEFTGAVKNVFGTVPGAIKPYLHFKNPRFENFLHVILDVYGLVRPALAFVDGVLAMEGQGPTTGEPKHVGLVAGGDDPVAVDAVLADLVSLPPVRLLQLAAQRGYGLDDLEQIAVEGPRERLRRPIKPAKPSKAKIGLLGKIKYGVRYYGVRPVIVTEDKSLLEPLVDLCPVGAIDLSGRPRIRRTCVKCMSCVESCQNHAVTLKVPKMLHGTYRSKAPGYDLSKMR